MKTIRTFAVALLAACASAAWGREIPIVPTNAPVAFLGDSLTAGWACAGKAVWAANFAGGPYRAANYGVGGYTTSAVLEVYEGADVTPGKQAELLPDGVHPNAEGYVRWREALMKVVTK